MSNLKNSKNLQLENFENFQFAKLKKCLIWDSKNFQLGKFKKLAIWKIRKISNLKSLKKF